jgi:hypothetical protein
MTKSIRISEKVHSRLKIHVAKNKESIVEFADWAITTAIGNYEMLKQFGNYREEIKKIMHPQSKSNSSTK